MSYQVFPLMNFQNGEVAAGTFIMIASAPFTGHITNLHARLDAGDVDIQIKVGSVIIPNSQLAIGTAIVSLIFPTPLPVTEDEPIYLLIDNPVDAENLYTQLTIERI